MTSTELLLKLFSGKPNTIVCQSAKIHLYFTTPARASSLNDKLYQVRAELGAEVNFTNLQKFLSVCLNLELLIYEILSKYLFQQKYFGNISKPC